MMQFSRIHLFFFLTTSFALLSCASAPRGSFDPDHQVTDYSLQAHWAALPEMRDSADAVPIDQWQDEQNTSPADVFFIHPTTFTGKVKKHQWNADLDNQKLNDKTDQTTIHYQASLFNGAGRVYAPRYRQSHLQCFYTRHREEAKQSLHLAYQDIKAAFEYYMKNYNAGRPFIIASHSQGTFHAKRLLHECIENTPLEKQFIVAYLVGYHVSTKEFSSLKPCTNPTQTGCYVSWRTFQEGYIPEKLTFPDSGIVVTNPVTWTDSIPACGKEVHLGGILRGFDLLYPQLLSTSIHDDLLWVSKPEFPGSAWLMTKNYHIADYNFFYADVRRNAQERVKAFTSGN